MIEPNNSLFYEIILEVLGTRSHFATRAVRTVEVVEKDHPVCKTLCIGKAGVIMVNPEFWKKQIKTRLDAKVVLVHEMLHSVLGDNLRKTPLGEEELANYSMDMRINSAIHSYFLTGEEKNTKSFLENYYKTQGLQSLLRPRSCIKEKNKYYLLYSTLYPEYNYSSWYNRRLTEQRQKFVDTNFRSEEAIRGTLKMLNPGAVKKVKKKVVFLGNHGSGEQNKGTKSKDAGDKIADMEGTALDEAGKDMLREELLSSLQSKNAGHGDVLGTYFIDLIESSAGLNIRLLEKFACSAKINTLRCMYRTQKRANGVIPIQPSNRDIAILGSGFIPVLWNNRVEVQNNINRNVAIYVDVSGSVSNHLPKIMGVIATMRRNIKDIFCFSNMVSEHTIAQISRGEFATTGGTDFSCVITHAVQRKIDKLIIFTDGYAGADTETRKLAELHIKDAAIVYFGEHTPDNFWDKTYGNVFQLEELLV